MVKIWDKRQIKNTDNTKTKHNPENEYNEQHNKTHSARKRDGLILQHSWAHTKHKQSINDRENRLRQTSLSSRFTIATSANCLLSSNFSAAWSISSSVTVIAVISFKQTMKVIQGHQHFSIQLIIFLLKDEAIRYRYIHRDRKKRPPKQNAVKCTIYNTI